MAISPDLVGDPQARFKAPRFSLLKWIGNKHKVAEQIAAYLPDEFGTFFDVFLGSGSVLATVAPQSGVGSDTFRPLMEIWKTLQENPARLKRWYIDRWKRMDTAVDRVRVYEEIKAAYNAKPNGADFLFLCRSCYGGVIRFRKRDGYMSTPCGAHKPIPPTAFNKRVGAWHDRLNGCEFRRADYKDVMLEARPGDVVYCDPPYSHSQAILYGAQDFSLSDLLEVIADCKRRGVFVMLSIDGTKRSGNMICDLPIPAGLFEREVFVELGRSMLKRFQMNGRSLEHEVVADRLLLTY
jgi:DNA adenine methylase